MPRAAVAGFFVRERVVEGGDFREISRCFARRGPQCVEGAIVDDAVEHDRAEPQIRGLHLISHSTRLAQAILLGSRDQYEMDVGGTQQPRGLKKLIGYPRTRLSGGGEELGHGDKHPHASEIFELRQDIRAARPARPIVRLLAEV